MLIFTKNTASKVPFIAAILMQGCASAPTKGLSLDYCTQHPSVSSCNEVLMGDDKDIWSAASRHAAANGNYSAAWAVLTLTPNDSTARTKEYLKNNPKIYEAAKRHFETYELENYRVKSAGVTVINKRLSNFNRFASLDDAQWAANNVETVVKSPGAMAQNNKPTVAKTHGRITDVQIINKSTINSRTGENIGSLAGQTMYIDGVTLNNYSASAQLLAGIAGGMLGASLDQPTQPAFSIKYWVLLKTGETITIDQNNSTTTHIPIGTCVEASKYTIFLANENHCR